MRIGYLDDFFEHPWKNGNNHRILHGKVEICIDFHIEKRHHIKGIDSGGIFDA